MITREMVIANILVQMSRIYHNNRREIERYHIYTYDLEFEMKEDIDYKLFKDKIKIFDNSIKERDKIKIDRIIEIHNSNRYDWMSIKIEVNNYKGISIYEIKARCKECKTFVSATDGWHSNGQINEYGIVGNKRPGGYCCSAGYENLKQYVGENNGKNKEEYFRKLKEFFENLPSNKDKFKLKTLWTIQCKNKHISFLKNAITPGSAFREIDCWICEIEQKYEFFKMIKDQLGANFYIKEEKKSQSYAPLGISNELKKISNLIVYTYNDKKHLTGKIVFNDPFGEEQAKANSNKLVFRWFEMKYLDDPEYCKTFFYYFYNEIIKRNKLK